MDVVDFGDGRTVGEWDPVVVDGSLCRESTVWTGEHRLDDAGKCVWCEIQVLPQPRTPQWNRSTTVEPK